jgi:hemerythrin-like domain-containing protein
MKRIEQLQSLSREHHLSLVLANKAIKIAKFGDEMEMKVFCQQVADEFEGRWEAHFRTEEHAIFAVIEDKYQHILTETSPEDAKLVALLKQQHQQMRTLSTNMQQGRIDQLAEFGQLLRDHTRLEERRLFPLISQLFNSQELAQIETS